ncbi:MAG TPA: DNA replication and repair protein RecF [Cyclobacteriaceae bacterium]|nr:DNA replication and repair protein RecF [Cyclobacteriaceae bacterium]
MFLQELRLFNFKNYAEASLKFDQPLTCFLGNNGSGKTNLLDAMHYLSFTKSAVNPADAQNVKLGENQFMIKGVFSSANGKSHEVICAFQQGQKKTIRDDGLDCTKFSEHVGKYPVVLIAPQDIELIWDGSEVRRKFFDSLLSQIDHRYLEALITYSSFLKQRNSALKMFADRGKTDRDLLAGYDQKIIPAAEAIFAKRKAFLLEFIPTFQKHYQNLSDSKTEIMDIQYRSDLDGVDFRETLGKNLERDLMLQRTTAGIHRDDFLFLLNGNEVKRYGSQGQQKSFLISLKLAEFQVIAERKKFKPLLLLDDIFDKLDDKRINKILKLVTEGMFGQLFITDARPDRCREILKDMKLEANIVTIENGKFT